MNKKINSYCLIIDENDLIDSKIHDESGNLIYIEFNKDFVDALKNAALQCIFVCQDNFACNNFNINNELAIKSDFIYDRLSKILNNKYITTSYLYNHKIHNNDSYNINLVMHFIVEIYGINYYENCIIVGNEKIAEKIDLNYISTSEFINFYK